MHTVNLRERMVPTVLNHFFGNLSKTTMAPTTVDGDKDFGGLVSLIGNSVREINDEYVRRIIMDDGFEDSYNKERESTIEGEIEFFEFSSWSRFPFYEADFGFSENVSRIIKALLVNAKISKDAKETVQECESEFISFITSKASDDLLFAFNPFVSSI
ncbi:stemmadenine O-acetyltransferase-like [Cornus florida]|uniref:stemmadenine O-acetyltransferase-like n=1 Tax=Cornus florida TaxID=4283 RepID=UPI00289D6C6C|nr:stemmadenine O-acetyltransferase-like [Cornus florida]